MPTPYINTQLFQDGEIFLLPVAPGPVARRTVSDITQLATAAWGITLQSSKQMPEFCELTFLYDAAIDWQNAQSLTRSFIEWGMRWCGEPSYITKQMRDNKSVSD